MIRIESPIAVATLIIALFVSVGVFPFLKTEHFRLTRPKIAALVIVLGYCIYHGSPIPALIFLWPLSFIWFPEFWGSFTGYIRGPYIDKKSPPIALSAFGWFFLVLFPIFVAWVTHL